MGLPLTSHNIPLNFHYPLVMSNSLLLKPWPIEIVDLPNLKMVIFNSYVTMFNYQRVYPIKMGDLGVTPMDYETSIGSTSRNRTNYRPPIFHSSHAPQANVWRVRVSSAIWG